MIIRLMGADFSENNIGELTTWNISWRGDGYTYDGELPRSVTKNDPFNITVNVASGYTYDSVPITVKMGGTDVPTSAISRNANGTITINIASVTGKLDILIGVASSGGGSGETEETTTWYIDHANQLIDNNIDITTGNGLGISAGAFAYNDATNAILVGKPINTVQCFVHTAGKFTFYRWNKSGNTLTEIQSFELANAGTTLQTYKFNEEFTLAEGEYLVFGAKTDVGKIYYFYNIDFGTAYHENLYYQVSASGGTILGSLCNLGMNIGYVG